jgi:hypothetical protein
MFGINLSTKEKDGQVVFVESRYMLIGKNVSLTGSRPYHQLAAARISGEVVSRYSNENRFVQTTMQVFTSYQNM